MDLNAVRARAQADLLLRQQERIAQLARSSSVGGGGGSRTPTNTTINTNASSGNKSSGKKRNYVDISAEEPVQRGRRGSSASKSTPSRSNTPNNRESGGKRRKSSSSKKRSATVAEYDGQPSGTNDDDDNNNNGNIRTQSSTNSNTNIWSLSSFSIPSFTTTTNKTPRGSSIRNRSTATANRRKIKTTYLIEGTAGTTEIDSNIATTASNRGQGRLGNTIPNNNNTVKPTTTTAVNGGGTRFGRLLEKNGIRLGKPTASATTTTVTTDPEPRPGVRIPRTKTTADSGALTTGNEATDSSSSTETQSSFFSGLFKPFTSGTTSSLYSVTSSKPTNLVSSSLSPNTPNDREIIGIDDDIILQPRKGPRTAAKPHQSFSSRTTTSTSISPLPSYNEPHINLTPIPKVHDNHNFSMSSIGGGYGGGSSILGGNALLHRANQLYQNFSSPFRSVPTVPSVVAPKASSGKKKTTTSSMIPSLTEGLTQYQAPIDTLPTHEDKERNVPSGGLRRRGRSTGPSSGTTDRVQTATIPTAVPTNEASSQPLTKAQTYVRIALCIVAIFLAIVVYTAVKNLLQIYRQHVLDTNISGKLRTLRGIVDCETPYGQTTDIEKVRIPILTLRKDYCNNIVTEDMCNSAIHTIINNKEYFNLTNIIGEPIDNYFPRSSLQKQNDYDHTGNDGKGLSTVVIDDDKDLTLMNIEETYGDEQYLFLHANEPAAIWTWNCKVGKAYDNIAYPVAAWRDRTIQTITVVIRDIVQWLTENWIVSLLLGGCVIYGLLWVRSAFVTKRNEAMVNRLWNEAKLILEERPNGISADLLPDLVIANLYGDKHSTNEGQRAVKLWSIVQKRLTNDKRIMVTTVQDAVTGVMHDAYIIRSTVGGYLSPGGGGGVSTMTSLHRSPSISTMMGNNNIKNNSDSTDNYNDDGNSLWNLQPRVRSRAYSGTL